MYTHIDIYIYIFIYIVSRAAPSSAATRRSRPSSPAGIRAWSGSGLPDVYLSIYQSIYQSISLYLGMYIYIYRHQRCLLRRCKTP